MITENEWRLVRQHIIKVGIILDITDDKGNYTDDQGQLYGHIEGIVNGGSINIDANSAVRRTASFTIVPTKSTVNVNEKSLVWLNKNVVVALYIYDQRTGQIGKTWVMGNFLYTSASSSYDASNNAMTIELSDWMTMLDGTINGQVGGVLTTTIPAYKEDPDTGEPLEYSTIKNAIEAALKSAGLTEMIGGPELNRYQVDDVGEYYAMPHPEHPEWDWEEYREKHPLWNTVPYDLEFSAGCSVWDIISELINLYPNYDGAYDADGVFRVKMIPSEYETEYDFLYDDYRDMVLSEQIQTDLSTIRNICEVWGDTLDADWYSENVRHGLMETYHVWFSAGEDAEGKHSLKLEHIISVLGGGVTKEEKTYTNISTYTTIDEDWKDLHITFQNQTLYIISNYTSLSWYGTHPTGDTIYTCSFNSWGSNLPDNYVLLIISKQNIDQTPYTVILDGYPKDYRTSTRFGVKFAENSYSGQTMRINDLEPLAVIDYSTGSSIDANFFDLDDIHVFQVMKIQTGPDNYIHQIYYIGVAQPHAIDVLTDGTVVQNGYVDPNTHEVFDLYSKAYYQHVLNCRNVSLTVCPESPFVVQKLGNRISVKEGAEFAHIRSEELAIERAQYENWKNARLTDNVTVTTKLMPFVTPYMKIDYKKNGSNERNAYIVQSVSHDFDNGTTTITMYTFYPLYKRQPGELDLMTYAYMEGYTNEDLYGDEDLT